ncbi:YHS domain-containing (seleno)protein [Yunchengibacter salinarum]|uniref:YHS domain-containing (seleno)protein n=1 Tax=Yunchengibacter salinarum TaxID=3133399 RepID=UPI0035B60F6E
MIKILTVSLALLGLATSASLADGPTASVAVGGYDLVSYFKADEPRRGNGHNAVTHDGTTYLFANAENAETFKQNPDKYLPAFGGYCAMGMAMGKKLHVDPLAYKIVDGQLYLNLDKKVQGMWEKNLDMNLEKARTNWDKMTNS